MKKDGALKGREIVLGVTGSIAAFKSAEIASSSAAPGSRW